MTPSAGGITISVEKAASDPRPHADRILRSVPEWFGIEEYTLKYIADAAKYSTWLARCGEEVIGFATLRRHFPGAAEVHCMATHRDWRGKGVGKAMVNALRTECGRTGVRYLQVKTQGPSRPSQEYAQTLKFYEAVGFTALEELTGVWPGIPCLVLIMNTDRGPSAS